MHRGLKFCRHALAASITAACIWAVDEAHALAEASPPQASIGFSKLVIRLDDDDEVGVAGAKHEIRLIEEMRAKGFHAVGAENLVFGKDDTGKASFLVGGTVRELECIRPNWASVSCWIGVEWQLLDVARDAVVYKVLTRAGIVRHPWSERASLGSELLVAAMDSLLERDGFRHSLAQHAGTQIDAHFTEATIATCGASKKLPDGTEDLLRATVVIKSDAGHGSGFFVTPDGLMLTAAHVVEGSKIRVRLREGNEIDAVVARVARHADVALLRTTTPLSGRACVPVRTDDPKVGTDVYVSGAPAGLAFSIAHGIVSGFPLLDGWRRVQTDTPVSPGNSGGPLVSADGNVIGIVASKFSGGKVEGLAFAVPMRETLSALGLRVGEKTALQLFNESTFTAASAVSAVEDEPDPIPSLKPASPVYATPWVPPSERQKPAAATALQWTGASLAIVGAGLALITYASFNSSGATDADYDNAHTKIAIGFTAVGVGAAAFLSSFLIPWPTPKIASGSSLRVGATGIQWTATF